MNCEGCGAPIEKLRWKRVSCEYCGRTSESLLRSVEQQQNVYQYADGNNVYQAVTVRRGK